MISRRSANASSRPAADLVCEAVCLGFALWTLCCHGVVAAGGSLLDLLATAAAAAGIALTLAWKYRALLREDGALPSRAPRVACDARREAGVTLAALGASVAVVAAYRSGAISLPVFWAGAMTVLGAAAWRHRRLAVSEVHTGVARRDEERWLWWLAVACVLVTAVLHRPDQDDAFYVNLAVAAADDPRAPILAFDTLHGIPDLPLHLALYRVQSYEIWNGALSYFTGIPALYVFHWVSASVGALLVPLAHARLLRRLWPEHWLAVVGALVFVVLAVGETHFWYGNYAFVRIWQGKGWLLFVFLPLVSVFAIELALRPDWRAGMRLSAAIIASLGCSTSAVWAAPFTAFASLAVAWQPSRRGLVALAMTALACVYPVAIGLVFKGETAMQLMPHPVDLAPGTGLADAFVKHLGEGHVQSFGLFCAVGAWACLPPGLARRFAIGLPLACFALLLNPFTEAFVSRNLLGPVFARGLWVLPVPLLMALVLVSPLRLARDRARQRVGRGVVLAGLVLFAGWVPTYSAFSFENSFTRLHWPGPKVRPIGYSWARELNRVVPPGAVVVAPYYVNTWVPTFHHHAFPLVVRIYLNAHAERLGARDFHTRNLMVKIAAGKPARPDAARIFRRGLDRYAVRATVLKTTGEVDMPRAALEDAGFVLHATDPNHELWLRPEASPDIVPGT